MSDDTQAQQHGKDAAIRFCMSTDGMKLGVSRYIPPEQGGRPLTVKSIHNQLANAGVTIAPEQGAAEKILARLRSGKDFKKIVLVRGIPAEEPSDGRIIPIGDLRHPVFSGQIIANKVLPTRGKPGKTIDGRVIEPQGKANSKPKDIKTKAGADVLFDPTELTFTAQTYGTATIKNGEVSILPGMAIDDDGIHVKGSVYFRDILGNAIEMESYTNELERLGVLVGPDEESIYEAMEKAKAERKIQHGVILARGTEPETGKDGWLEILVDRAVDDTAEDEQGRLDYRHRASLPMVEAGQRVAKVHPPTPGKGGIDLYNKTIPARGGRIISVSPGEGIKRIGRDVYEAATKGLLVYEQKQISVSEVLVVRRDVGLATGHITAEFGSVHIQGSVTNGMKVAAPQQIVVQDAVESAYLEAGGDIEIKGGILMPDGGLVKAGANIYAQFATNARIEADGDVIITNNLTNSSILAQGKFISTEGKGVVQGGFITSYKGVEVNELGTEIGVATEVIISQKQRNNIPVLKARGKIKRELERIYSQVGKGNPKAILKATPEASQKRMLEILKYRIKLEKKFDKINAFMRKDTKRRQVALSKARIKVYRRIHSGVTLKIGGRVLNVDKPIDRSQIYYDHVSRQIVIRSL